MKPSGSVPWLNTSQAAQHLGFTKADGSPNIRAFLMWKCRHKPRAHKLAGRLRFRQTDLDACVEPEVEQVPSRLQLVGGRHRV